MIVFHSVDADGWCSGALAKMYLDPEGELTYANYNQDKEAVRRILERRPQKLYVVDYTFQPEDFEKIMDACGEIYWYDHHAKAINEASDRARALPGRRSTETENRVSAAWLVYQDCPQNDCVKRAVQLVSDYDTFSFDDDNILICAAPAFNAYISFDRGGSVNQLYRVVDFLQEMVFTGGMSMESALEDGFSYLSNEINNAVGASKRAVFGTCDGLKFAAINSANLNPAYVCKPHQKDCDFVFCWYMLRDGKIKLDLRSDKKTGADVSRIAGLLGGGGHEHAAGCTVTLDTFLKIMEKKI